MDLQTVKLNVMQKIMGVTTPSLLDKINELLDHEMIVGYTVDGEPLTLDAYNKRLKKAVEQLKAGEFISQEDLEKEAEEEFKDIQAEEEAKEAETQGKEAEAEKDSEAEREEKEAERDKDAERAKDERAAEEAKDAEAAKDAEPEGKDTTGTGDGTGDGTGTGTGTGDGDGDGDGDGEGDGAGGGGMLTGGGTSQVAVPTGGFMLQQAQMILPPKKDYMVALDGLLSEFFK